MRVQLPLCSQKLHEVAFQCFISYYIYLGSATKTLRA